MISGVLFLLAIAFLVWTWKNFSKKPAIASRKNFQQFKTSNYPTRFYTKNNELSDQEKGERFEHWVIDKFNPQYFSLHDWRSDKHHNGVYPKSNMHPDLVYEFHLRHHKIRFAVECKWRADYFNNGIDFAKPHQVKNYLEYHRDEKIPVFIIIGVGGKCDNPLHIYIIPITRIRPNQTFLDYKFLREYKRSNHNRFFYLDLNSMLLT